MTSTKVLDIEKHTILQIMQASYKLIHRLKYQAKDLSSLSDWLREHKLSVNVEKTELFILRLKKRKTSQSFKFKSEHRFSTGSNPVRGVSKTWNGEDH